MTTSPLVVLVDDEPYQHQRVAALLPETRLLSCYTAKQALERCAALKRQNARVALVLIDYRLPDFDGALLAATIRAELPDVPFAPFSALPNSAALIGVSGAVPFPPKGVDDVILGRALREAMNHPAPGRPDPILRSYLAEIAAIYARRQPAAKAVALFAGSRAVLSMLVAALQTDGVPVAVQGTSAAAIRPLLSLQSARVLVCDVQALPAAHELARALGVPLLCVTLSVSVAVSLAMGDESLLVTPELGALAVALAAMAEGKVYRDPLLGRVYAVLGLTANERTILPHVLDGASPAMAVQTLGGTELAYSRARLRLLERLGAAHLGELRARIDSALTDERL